jgi:hypothetical protein
MKERIHFPQKYKKIISIRTKNIFWEFKLVKNVGEKAIKFIL